MQLMSRPEMTPELRKLIRRDGGAFNAAHALRKAFFPDEYLITVPDDATAEGLVETARSEFERAGTPLTDYFDRYGATSLIELLHYDLKLVRGRTCEILLRDAGCEWRIEDGRSLQRRLGFDGNAAAEFVWATARKPFGDFISVPDVDSRLYYGDGGHRYAMNFSRSGGSCQLGGKSIWRGYCKGLLVAFRPIG